MSIKNSMKSVIAQGATVVKAIEEGLKKADNPQEFFVKILEEAQAGFLGFGSKKAKIALFFKKDVRTSKPDAVLSQLNYQELFDSPTLQKQIDAQQNDLGLRSEQAKETNSRRPSFHNEETQSQNSLELRKVPARSGQRRDMGPVDNRQARQPNRQTQAPTPRSEKPSPRPSSTQPAPFGQNRNIDSDRSNSSHADSNREPGRESEQPRSSSRRRSRYYSPRSKRPDSESEGGHDASSSQSSSSSGEQRRPVRQGNNPRTPYPIKNNHESNND